MLRGIIFFRNLDREHLKQEKGGNRIKFHDWAYLGIGSCKFKAARNSIPKFRQSSINSEKPGYLSEKLKTLTCSNYNKV